MQKNVIPGGRKGCTIYSPEFNQQLIATSCELGISISKLALENGINSNLLFKWREGKLLFTSSERPQLLPVTPDAAVQPDHRNAESMLAPAVWLSYSPDRKGIHPLKLSRRLQRCTAGNAYAGFNDLYRNG
ncbi:Transposase [Kluyvera ascorbata]|nr:Transposase [Kluyvera ascorbata]